MTPPEIHTSKFAHGIKVAPLSALDISQIAGDIRSALRMQDVEYLPVVQILEILAQIYDGFNFCIITDDELPKNVYAVYNPMKGTIYIKEKIYTMAAKENNGFARWTIMHECGHFFLHSNQTIALARQESNKHHTFEDSEWQANTFAAEMLAPLRLIRSTYSIEEVAHHFGISKRAAELRIEKINRTIGGRTRM